MIEDLDRCGAKCINETLDAVRLIVDLPGVIVVLLIDHRIAFKAVEQRFSPLADGLRSSQVIAPRLSRQDRAAAHRAGAADVAQTVH